MSDEWNKMTDEMKKPYMVKAENDKKRYMDQMREYERQKRDD